MSYLALDLGAGSGRAIVGSIRDGKIYLDEVHRFSNSPVKLGDTLYWDFLALFENIKQGIRLAVKKGYILNGIAVDTWGVDFGLIDKNGNLLSNPVCYRDKRTSGLSDKSSEYISKEQLYSITGIQQMDINTVFQLLSMVEADSPFLSVADKLLFTPDLVNYFLTGKVANEYTIASTSQMLDAETKEWDRSLFHKLSLPVDIMPEIIFPCTQLGKLTKDISEETGAIDANVIAVGSHDTASAIAAIPEAGADWAFLSSGTWSLLGVLNDEPVLTRDAMLNDFTNEGGVDNKILFMRNITGLWLLQRLIAEWEKEELNTSYEYILSEATKVVPFRSIVNSDDPVFSHPVSMSEAIRGYCSRTGQYIPETQGELVRCVLESLAIKYSHVLEKLRTCSQKDISRLHVVGGGSQNELLNQFIADALDISVTIGLTEATAVGNIIQQAIVNKQISGWDEAHQIIKCSFTFKTYYPQDTEKWRLTIINTKHLFDHT
ncbi:rhamnulokinase [Dysgonomonas hofstadii]|uniref:Rhamnulokinase n=1 Tax=Dysgonomonas hofstadii TaxID=637886 RepID=A0A840CQG9_9BACT|nr:rhamnulokinase family protein [Dysgonomonas hofstadii]MBB4035854.1 rhamnulokinase [Dysgonomonas hofstadii]